MQAADKLTQRLRHYRSLLATTSILVLATVVIFPTSSWADFTASDDTSANQFAAAETALSAVKAKIGLDRGDSVTTPATPPDSSRIPPIKSSKNVVAGFKHHDELAKILATTTASIAAIPAIKIVEPVVSGFDHHPKIVENKTATVAHPIPTAVMLGQSTSKQRDTIQMVEVFTADSPTVAPASNVTVTQLLPQKSDSDPVLDADVATAKSVNTTPDGAGAHLPPPILATALPPEALVLSTTNAITNSRAAVGFQHSPVQMASLPPVPTAGMEVHFTRTDPSIGSFHVTPRLNDNAPTDPPAAPPKSDANVPALAAAGFEMPTTVPKSENDVSVTNEATTWAAQLQILERENQALRSKLQMNETDHLSDIKVDAVAKIHEEVLRDRVTQLEKELDKLSMQKDRALPQKTGTPPVPPTPEQLPTMLLPPSAAVKK